MKKAVGNIQLILNKNGYDAGGADGVMGEQDQDGDHGLPEGQRHDATGEVTSGRAAAEKARRPDRPRRCNGAT